MRGGCRSRHGGDVIEVNELTKRYGGTTGLTTDRTEEAGAEPRARFRDLVAAEWIKLWSLRSTFWTLLLPLCFTTKYRWTADIEHALPASAWERLIDIGYGRFGFVVDRPTTTTEAWIALASWSIAAAVVAVTLVRHRDV
jgi:hypothetical protein